MALIRSSRQPAEPVRVLQITDPHLFADADATLRGRVTRATLQRVLDHVEQSNWPADLVAMTGDLIQDNTRAAYERFRSMMTPVGLPVYCVPGNHDNRPLMREVLDHEPFFYCASVETGNWLIAGIDSCIDGAPAGRVEESELERLDGLIAGSAADHVMVCLHHPPLPVGSDWLDSVGLQNGEQFLRRITASGKVKLAVFGHVHQAFDGSFAAVRILGTPSTCRQFEVASETFAVDDRPPGYRRIALYNDGNVDTDLIWT
ncbi:MAG TPA: metallophosphoesterase [Woeseiaceae bacterium]|nr:metallophosphoesterase [Woeseiaceae bacterium]